MGGQRSLNRGLTGSRMISGSFEPDPLKSSNWGAWRGEVSVDKRGIAWMSRNKESERTESEKERENDVSCIVADVSR